MKLLTYTGAFFLLVALGLCWRSGQAPSLPGAPGGAAGIQISIANSSAKEEWLHRAVQTFNGASGRDAALQVDGKPIIVEVLQETIDGKKVDYRSGTMVSDTLDAKIKPTIL